MIRWKAGATVWHWLQVAFRAVCIVGVVIALIWFVRGLNVSALGDSLARASVTPLVLAVAANIGLQYVRAAGWKVMLAPRHRIPLGRLVRYEFTAQAASAITPAQAGELVRAWLLKRHHDVPTATTGALIVLEKLFGSLGMVALVVATPWLLPHLPRWVDPTVILFAVGMVLLLAVLVIVARRPREEKQPTILRRVVDGMYMLRDTRRMLAVLALAVLGELADLLAVIAILHALDIKLPLAGAALLLFLIDMMNLLPSGPGRIGTFEIAAVSAFGLFPVTSEIALAFALIFHAQQVLPQTLVGLPSLFRLPMAQVRRSEPAAEREPERSGTARSGAGP